MLVFYGSSTLLRAFRSVNLSTQFPDKPPRQFTSIVSAHSFASNWKLPFLNRRKGDNGRRTFFMTNLLPRMCAGREDGIRDWPHTRRTTAKKFKSRRVVHAAERLTIPRSMSSVRYSLEAVFKSLTQTASRCTKSFVIIKQSSWSDWNTI